MSNRWDKCPSFERSGQLSSTSVHCLNVVFDRFFSTVLDDILFLFLSRQDALGMDGGLASRSLLEAPRTVVHIGFEKLVRGCIWEFESIYLPRSAFLEFISALVFGMTPSVPWLDKGHHPGRASSMLTAC